MRHVDYIHRLNACLNGLNFCAIDKAVKLISKSNSVYVFGNGGSLATAEHFAVDLVKYGKKKAFSLTTPAMLSMVANDFGYKHSFSWIIERFARQGDAIIGISTSGRSENVLRGLCSPKVKSILITGIKGRNAGEDMDVSIVIDSDCTQVIEDMSLIICHMIALGLQKRKDEKK